MRHAPSLAMVLVAAVTVSLCPRSGSAAVEAPPAVEQFARAWMGAVTLLATDRCECGEDGCERCGREDGRERDAAGHARGEHDHSARPHRGHRAAGPGAGPGRSTPGPQAVIAKMDEILARLARIEAKLDGRGAGPGRSDMRGPSPRAGGPGPRPEMPEQARRMMEERMRRMREGMSPEDRARMEERMRAARERMRDGGSRPEGRPDAPVEAREQMRQRMEEGRERMEQARQAFRQMEERVKKLEAEIARMKADR